HCIHLQRSLFLLMTLLPPRSTLFPYTTLFRSQQTVALKERAEQLAQREDALRRHVERLKEGGQTLAAERKAHFEAKARWESERRDRKSTRLNSSHVAISYAVFCLKKKNRSTCS